MSSPNKQVVLENVYEVPTCTICIQVLVEELVSLDCGHIYHAHCIYQHLERRSSCPNCQKRASMKEVRPLHYHPTHSDKHKGPYLSIMSNLNPQEKKHVDYLLKELKTISVTNEKLKSENASNDKSLKSQVTLIDILRQQVHKSRAEIDKIKKENVDLDISFKDVNAELKNHLKLEMSLRLELNRLKSEEKEFEQMKMYAKLMKERSDEIVEFKKQLQSNGTPAEEMSKTFFDMLLMKNLEVLRMKERLREFPEKMNEREMEVVKLKATHDTLRKELKQVNEKKAADRKKYDELKSKFRNLSEKAKQKGVKEHEIPEMEDSQSFATLTKTLHIPQISNLQATQRKPFFNPSSSTFGGFRPLKKSIE